MIPEYCIEAFMRESNMIEHEYELELIKGVASPIKVGRINKGDIDGASKFLKLDKVTAARLLSAHKTMFGHRMDDAGSYRLYNVRVGPYTPPDWKDVPELMKAYFKNYAKMDAWTAHNEFEKIHPFGDGNGRLGRLLWLWKMIQGRGFDFQISFLHLYYYQTLQAYEDSCKSVII